MPDDTLALRMLLKQKPLADFKRTIDERYRSRSLAAHLRNIELFRDVDDDVIDMLRKSAELVSFEPGAQIFEQDTPGDAFYMVRGGYVKVGLKAGAASLAVTYLRKGDHRRAAAADGRAVALLAVRARARRNGQDRARRLRPRLRRHAWRDATLHPRGNAVPAVVHSGRLYQCTDPVCMIGCPTGAITRPVGTREVTINKDTCIGCHHCIRRCPRDNIIEVPVQQSGARPRPRARYEVRPLSRPVGRSGVRPDVPHGSAVRISFTDQETVAATLSGETASR